jgi:citrate/tricarballylate utilization protein
MHATEVLAEADRLMTICNSCRYCEGLCAVFPAMETRRAFPDGDLNYLANLCHGCGACLDDCQFAPPHEFSVNVPRTFATARAESYAAYAWPSAGSVLFKRNGLAVACIAVSGCAGFLLGFRIILGPTRLVTAETGPGAFYRLMPHGVMAGLFGGVFLYAMIALAIGFCRFWRDPPGPPAAAYGPRAILQAMKDAGRLRYLDGGGGGCVSGEAPPADRRRFYHHCTFYGFLLCFAATAVASIYHFLLGREAPYAWDDLPVVLGGLGGIGLVIGPVGLAVSRRKRDPALTDARLRGMDLAFSAMLLLTGVTGLALLLGRATPAMGLLLALHLGIVFGLFITLPYGKFVHGLYRFAALVRSAQERHAAAAESEP